MVNIKHGECRKLCMEYMLGDVSIEQTQYMYSFNSKRDAFFITYTIANNEDFEEIFEKHAKEIKIASVECYKFDFTLEPLTF